MDDATFRKYMAEDFAQALKFYDDRACSSKLCHRRLSVYLIVVAAILTPVVAFAPDNIYWRVFSAALSTSIVVSTALTSHLKCHENWLSYRGAWDAMQRERRLFETGVGAYEAAPNKNALFVARVETILASEGGDFYARHAKDEQQTKTAAVPVRDPVVKAQ